MLSELLALSAAAPNHPNFQAVLTLFKNHMQGVANYQDNDGRWHQVLDQPTTFLETSASSMYLWAMIKGVEQGWLSKDTYDPFITKAWSGISSTIASDGVVSGICEGTGIGSNVDFYQKRSTNYLVSSPGLGSVLRAIAAYQRYSMKM